MARLLLPMLNLQERLKHLFEDEGGVDFAYTIVVDGQRWRLRVNVMQQLGHLGLVARRVNITIPNFEQLHLPSSLANLCTFAQGMILLSGTTGSGKSTTIASMLDWINHRYRRHILTLEDPIEFTFTADKCLVNQREIGMDVRNFETGMKHAVREDPDVMLVGEMRDRLSFETAIQAAETGHLVFGTVHASTAPSTIGRILDLFPRDMHAALRSAMVFNMKAIIAQKLLPSILPSAPPARLRDHDLLADGAQTALGGTGRQAARRNPHRQGRRHAGLCLGLVRPGGAGNDRPGHGVRGGPQRRGAGMALKGIKLKESAML